MITLDEFIRSDYFMCWDSDNRSPGGAGMILSDPERFDRIMKAAEEGSEGSTHGEIIQDWREALKSSDLDDETKAALAVEIDQVEDWHVTNGSIDQEID